MWTFWESEEEEKNNERCESESTAVGRDSSAIHLVESGPWMEKRPFDFFIVIITVFGRLLRTFSCWALRFEFQQNSKMATTMAIARPHSRTTNTPPIVVSRMPKFHPRRKRTDGRKKAGREADETGSRSRDNSSHVNMKKERKKERE